MNHFFALTIPPAILLELGKLAEEWQQMRDLRASWYAPADYHITLKFLGNVDPSRQPELNEAAQPVATVTTPFVVDLNAPAGAFSSVRSPGVVWAGVKENEQMALLAGCLDSAMEPLGFARERRAFNAHITLARVRDVLSPGQLKALGWKPTPVRTPAQRQFPLFTADRFVLMQSSPPEKPGQTVKNSGRLRYNTVRTFPFGVAEK